MDYLFSYPDRVFGYTLEHLRLVSITLIIALLIAIPVGVFVARHPRIGTPIIGLLTAVYTIPSLALFALLIPWLGLGLLNAVTALVAYSLSILVRNIAIGLRGVDPVVLEAATGMGMSPWQAFYKVELPLALPVIVAGIRIATVSVIAIATVAAFVNAGGLGTLLFDGLRNESKIFAGVLAVAALSISIDQILRLFERRAASTTLKAPRPAERAEVAGPVASRTGG